MRLAFFLILFLSGCGSTWGSQPTRVEPLPLKVGGLRDSSIEVAIPLKIEKKKYGGYRSPIELRGRILLTTPDSVSIPLIPAGGQAGMRIRW